MAWALIPCLVQLRAEFNSVAPDRDKGADGSIGDSSHTSSSDHTPDEDSDALRDHDADSKNEVHALDIDSDGPWPDGTGREAGGWLDRTVRAIAARERKEYLSPDIYGRLQYIIWRGQIISRSWGWSEWRTYDGPSKHFDHVHFSARYLTSTEADTRPWGVEDDVTEAQLIAAVTKALASTAGQASLAKAAGVGVHGQKLGKSQMTIGQVLQQLPGSIAAADVDEQAIAAAVLAGLPVSTVVSAIVAALPPELARQVADEIAQRLQA